MTVMLKTVYDEMVPVVFQNQTLMLNKGKFDYIKGNRDERIRTKQYFIAGTKEGNVTRDRFATSNLALEVGGEISGVELMIIIPPKSEGRYALDEAFGENWINVD